MLLDPTILKDAQELMTNPQDSEDDGLFSGDDSSFKEQKMEIKITEPKTEDLLKKGNINPIEY